MSTLFDVLRKISATGKLSQIQVDGINAILQYVKQHPDISKEQVAYILATAWHESAQTMQPILETKAKSVNEAIEILDKFFNAGKLTWVKKRYWLKDKDGHSWLGRGLVQITHKDNYKHVGDCIGVDLCSDPDVALRPDIAVKILVEGMKQGLFTGGKHRLSNYITGNKKDYVGARRIINGTDRADMIAGYANKILGGLMSG